MSDAWRLLLDAPAGGAWNMAVDEVLLDGVAAGNAPPTLRFYGWTPPCLSLGYFQPFDVVDLEACRSLRVEVVRRPTGGRAILHDRELTYSVALPASALGHDGGVLPSYHRLSLALQDGLQRLGVPATLAPQSAPNSPATHGPVCFDRPSAHEILLHGRKLVGSAQMRRGGALLQHGSILIEPAIDRLVACLRLSDDAGIADGVAGVAEMGVTDPARIASAIAQGFAARFAVSLVEDPLGSVEKDAARSVAESKYRSARWTERPAPAIA